MDLFDTFLESLKREDNIDIIESFQRGYEYLLEAEAKEEAKKEEKPILDKKYLLSLTANEQGEVDGAKLKAAKNQAREFLIKEGFDTLFEKKEQSNIFIAAVNFFTKFILQGDQLRDNHVLYLHDLVGDNDKKELFKLLQDPDILKDDLDNIIELYNEKKEKVSKGNLTDEEFAEYSNVKVLHEFKDGWKWVMLLDKDGNPKSRCTIEAKQMGHCGTASGQEVLYSLRKGPKSSVTIAVNKATNQIAQSKGRANTKVNLQKYGKYMIWLFKSDLIKGINDSGYAPDRNTHVSDFLPIDPTIVEYFEQNKPEMISERYDKKVLDIKRKLASGELNDEQVVGLFEKGELTLALVKGILGNKKFFQLVDEPMAIRWIKTGKLYFRDIIQTETKMFTNDIQKELVLQDRSNYKHFKRLQRELDTFKINPSLDIWQMRATNGHSIKDLNSEDQISLINKNKEELEKLLKQFPSSFSYFNDDVKVTVVNTMPEMFFGIMKTNPDILNEIHPVHRTELFKNHKDAFADVLENKVSALEYFPPEKRKEIFDTYQMDDKYKDLFKKAFINDRDAIKYFPRADRLEIINTYPELFQEFDPKSLKKIPKAHRLDALNKYPDTFVKFFAEKPATIGLFEKADRLNIILSDKFKNSFNEGFKKDISAIGFFPNENEQIQIFKIYKDSILELLNDDPEEIDYFSDDMQEKLIKHFNINA